MKPFRIDPEQSVVRIVAGVLSTIPGQPSKMHPEHQLAVGAGVVNVVVDNLFEREWRCWREDGSYYGPCTPEKIAEWKAEKRGGWAYRHADCGWMHYVMEEEASWKGPPQ